MKRPRRVTRTRAAPEPSTSRTAPAATGALSYAGRAAAAGKGTAFTQVGGAQRVPSTGTRWSGKVWERQLAYILRMTQGRTGRLLALALSGALVHSAAAAIDLHEHSEPAQISFDVPGAWVVDDEAKLFEVGFIVPPEPLYALVASPAKTPAFVAFNPSSVPWLFVTVETDQDLLPPSQLFELAPQYLQKLATQSGPASTEVKTLTPHHPVHQGGLSGSAAALMVVSPAGSTSFDELAYEEHGRLWLVIAGCSASCYAKDRATISQIVRSVRVGTAS